MGKRTTSENKLIGEFVKWFYENIVGYTPDATQYKQAWSILDNLLVSASDLDDIELTRYNLIQLTDCAKALQERGLRLETLTIFHYPNLVSSFVRGDHSVFEAIADRLKEQQRQRGIWTAQDLANMIPNGYDKL